MGLEEQRLVEMAKLQRQFSDACEGSGLTRKNGGGGGESGKGGDGEVGGSAPAAAAWRGDATPCCDTSGGC